MKSTEILFIYILGEKCISAKCLPSIPKCKKLAVIFNTAECSLVFKEFLFYMFTDEYSQCGAATNVENQSILVSTSI